MYLDLKREKYYSEYLKVLVRDSNLEILRKIYKLMSDLISRQPASASLYDRYYYIGIVEAILLTSNHILKTQELGEVEDLTK